MARNRSPYNTSAIPRCREIYPYDIVAHDGVLTGAERDRLHAFAEKMLRCERRHGHEGRHWYSDETGYLHLWRSEPPIYFTTDPSNHAT